MQTGSVQFIRPSMGSWILYGLGTENQNLPGFVVISPVLYGDDGSPLHYNNAFLPAIYQGTYIPNSEKTPDKLISYIRNPSTPLPEQRRALDGLELLVHDDPCSMATDLCR